MSFESEALPSVPRPPAILECQACHEPFVCEVNFYMACGACDPGECQFAGISRACYESLCPACGVLVQASEDVHRPPPFDVEGF